MTVLLVREGPEEQTRTARDAVARAFPDQPLETVAKGEDIGAGAAAVVLPWRGAPQAVAPVALALRHRRRGRRVYWTAGGRLGTCGPWFFLREGTRYLWFRALDLAVRCAARAGGRGGPAPTTVGSAPGDGPVVFVLAVLPDLSHTFVYREVLAALRQRPDARVLFLQQGERVPVHPEAAELLRRARAVPRRGITRHHASVLRWLVAAPRRARRLLALYRDRPGGRPGDPLGKGPLREACHPGRGFALADALRGTRPSHIHVYGSTYAANVAMEAAILLDVPFSISSYVDFDFDYDFKMLPEKYRLARFFRVCTRFCQRRLAELLALDDLARVPVVMWGLDLSAWPARTTPPEPGVLFTAARLVEKKGLHLMPPALARLLQRGVRFRWRVAGDGPELPRLQARIAELGLQEHVELLGPLGNDAVRDELRRAELAVLPCVVAADGERDGIPIFLTEAMALGVPVLTTPVSGIPEVVRDGDTGFLAEPGSVEDLAARLEAALGDPARREEVARRGREEIAATHDVDEHARALLRAIEGERRQ